ncbi:MAG: tol-pal system-associated acyl-CoA thioesterase [Alphaproteobacteria bacterium]
MTGPSRESVPGSGYTDEARRCHIFPVRVYYEDTDAMGIVFYVNYLKYAERARTEVLRLQGREQDQLLRERGLGFVVRRCEVDYLAPARLDDILRVETYLHEVGAASLRLRQDIFRDAVKLSSLVLRLAFVSRAGKPERLPRDLRESLESLVSLR